MNPDALITAGDTAETYINVYRPDMPNRSAAELSLFGKLTFGDVYPGIDLVLYAEEGDKGPSFKYDFIVSPGADCSMIELEYAGFDQAEVNDREIAFELTTGTLRETVPASWFSPGRAEADVRYTNVSQHGNVLRTGFNLPEGREIPSGKSLVIDPLAFLEWSSFYGGEETDVVNSIAVDSLGIVFAAGTTSSPFAMASDGAYQNELAGGETDAFLSRFNQHGLRMWSTYYGGGGADEGRAAGLSGYHHVYLAGKTFSSDTLDTENPHQPDNAGDADGFVARFDRLGNLIWDSFLGGSEFDEIVACDVDLSGNIYVAGNTESSSFAQPSDTVPATLSGSYSGGRDAFIAKFSDSGEYLGGRYFGGPGDETATAVHLADSALFLAGYTNSETGIASEGAFQTTFGGGEDGFLAVFEDELPVLSTYFGAEGDDRITGVAADSGRVFLTGYTDADMGYADDSLSHQPEIAGGIDAFLLRFDSLNSVAKFTYLGGDSTDMAHGVDIDRSGQIFITGTTFSENQIDDNDSTGTQYSGNGDVFLARYNENLEKIWGRYHGSVGAEDGRTLAAYGYTAIFFGGSTASPGPSGLAQENGEYSTVHQFLLAGEQDGFLARYNQSKSTPPPFICSGVCESDGSSSGGGSGSGFNPPGIGLCIGDSLRISVSGGALGTGAEWIWYESDCGATDQFIGEGNAIWVSPTATTVYWVRAESVDDISDCVSVTVHVDHPPTAEISEPDSVCFNGSAQLTAGGAVFYDWTGPDEFTAEGEEITADSLTYEGSGTFTVIASTMYGCTDTASTEIHVLPLPELSVETTDVTCIGFEDGSASVTVTPEESSVYWPHADTTMASMDNLPPGSYTVTAVDPAGCTATDSLLIEEPLHPIDSLHVTDAWCDDKEGAITLFLGGNTAPYITEWSPGDLEGTEITNLSTGFYEATVTDANGCTYFAEAEVGNLGFFDAEIPQDTVWLGIEGSEYLEVNITPAADNLTYLWEPDIGLSCSDCESPLADPDSSLMYHVTVVSNRGCFDTDSVYVDRELPPSEPFIPNIFSPNGDGLNDALCVLSDRIETLRLEIYNRRGDLVFSTTEQSECWDGTHQGVPVDNGAYVYHLQVSTDEGEFIVDSGNLSVIR